MIRTTLGMTFLLAWLPAQAMDYSALRCVMESHAGWPSVTNADLLTWGNTPSVNYRSPAEEPRHIWDVLAENYDEYEALSDARREVIRTSLFAGGNQTVDISTNDTPLSAVLLDSYQAGSDTRTALVAAFVRLVTPFECGGVSGGTCPNYGSIGHVRDGDLDFARTDGVCAP